MMPNWRSDGHCAARNTSEASKVAAALGDRRCGGNPDAVSARACARSTATGDRTHELRWIVMQKTALRALLEAVRLGQVPVEEALNDLRDLPFADLGFAHVDHHRALRVGLP